MRTRDLSPLKLLLAVLFALVASNALAAEPTADARTKALVEQRLLQTDLANFHQIDVAVVDGVVTLRGSARTAQARDAIQREVGKIAGVREVHADIKVQPTP